MSAITNMAKMRNFEVTPAKFNVIGMCTTGKYVQKYFSI